MKRFIAECSLYRFGVREKDKSGSFPGKFGAGHNLITRGWRVPRVAPPGSTACLPAESAVGVCVQGVIIVMKNINLQ